MTRRIPPLPRNRPLPLAYAQEPLWFLDQLGTGGAYNVGAIAAWLHGGLDALALERALVDLVRRHEALRTRFAVLAPSSSQPAAEGTGRPAQIVSSAPEVPFLHIDLTALPATRRREETKSRAAGLAATPFDLTRGPLLRAALFRLQETEHFFSLSIHHIVFDGWSRGILHRELAILYAQHTGEATASPLPPLGLQPADLAFRQRLALRDPAVLAALVGYWRQQLAGLPPLLALPTDRPRPAARRHRGAWQPVSVPAAVEERLAAFCRDERATLFMATWAAFALVLGRLAGSSDVAVGTPIAGRDAAGHGEDAGDEGIAAEGMIGCFVNTLVLRADLAGDPSWRGLVARLRSVALGAFDHRALPFARLVDELGVARDLSHSPLVQVIFALQSAPGEGFQLPGLAVTEAALPTADTKFDLTLSLGSAADGGLHGALEHDTDLFHPATARRFAAAYSTLLTAVLDAPDRPLSTLDLLAPAERHQLLREWNDTDLAYPREATIHQLFFVQARRRPDAVALVSAADDSAVTYATLARQATALAHRLTSLGVRPESPVGLAVPRSGAGMSTLAALLGILAAGGAYVPLDPAAPRERRDEMIRAAGLRWVLASPDAAEELAGSSAEVVVLPARLPVEPGTSLPFHPLDRETDPRQLAYILHTSGSTGAPKGVEVPHRAVLRLVHPGPAGYARLSSREVFLQLAPLAFDASTFEIWGALLHGGRLVLPPPEPPDVTELSRLLARHQVTTLWLTAGLFHALAESAPTALAGVPQLLAGGDVLAPSAVRAVLQPDLRERYLINGYGPTEATTFTTCHRMAAGERLPDTASVPIGRPLANTRVRLLDRDLQPVPLGAPGELWIGGDGLARGYAGDPAATAERFRPDPMPAYGGAGEPGGRLYRSGDLARFLPDGRLDFLGRADAQVKVRGFRVEPAAIEAVLAGHPAIRQAAVLAESHGTGRRLVACLILGASLDAADLRTYLLAWLPDYQVPALYVRVDALPLNANGKLDRAALAACRAAGDELTGRYLEESDEGPAGAAERLLAGLWRQLLGRREVGRHERFFDLGGDSLLALQVVARANQAGLALTVRQLLTHPTLAELGRVVAATTPADGATAEQGWVSGPVPLTPGQRWFFDRVLPGLTSPHTFSTPALFALHRPFPAARAAEIVERLAFQHDALRLRVRRRADGWEQWLPGREGLAGMFSCVDLSALPAARRDEAVGRVARWLLGQTELAGTPLARGLYLPGGEDGDRLLLVLHHLVSDEASWRLLGEDLATLCGQAAAGRPLHLPAKSTSFRQWAEHQAALARSPELYRQMDDWLGWAAQGAVALPVDGPGGDFAVSTLAVRLTEAATRALLESLPATTGAPFASALLTAVARALADWTGAERVLIRQTHHGRDPDVPGIDLSRTVGWISTTAPVLLQPGPADSPREAIARIDAQVRQVPLGGLGYGLLRYLSGDAEVARRMETVVASPLGTFNFLGRADAAADPGAPLHRLSLPHWHPPSLALKTPQLRLSAYVDGPPTELVLSIAWGTGFYRRETIEKLAGSLREALLRLVPGVGDQRCEI